MFRKVLALFLSISLIYSSITIPIEIAYAQGTGTIINGNITANATWNLAGSPYTITSDVNIASGIALTIEPGVDVVFDGSYFLNASDGTLTAVGTPTSPVTFTSGQAVPAAGDWQYLRLSTSSRFENGIIKYSQYGTGGINVLPILVNVTAHDNVQGFTFFGASPNIVNNKIYNNGTGIWLAPGTATSVGLINNNEIRDNANHNVFLFNGPETLRINTERNWWGTVDPFAIASKLWFDLQDPLLPELDLLPYLNAVPTTIKAPVPASSDQISTIAPTAKLSILVKVMGTGVVNVIPTGCIVINNPGPNVDGITPGENPGGTCEIDITPLYGVPFIIAVFAGISIIAIQLLAGPICIFIIILMAPEFTIPIPLGSICGK